MDDVFCGCWGRLHFYQRAVICGCNRLRHKGCRSGALPAREDRTCRLQAVPSAVQSVFRSGLNWGRRTLSLPQPKPLTCRYKTKRSGFVC